MAMRKPGTYAPLSANYADDEAIMAAGEDAELLYIRMLAYAARTPLTEGWISDAVLTTRIGILPRMTGNGAGIEPGTDAGSRARKLCEVGLIASEGTGHRIVSWLRWNKSASEMRRESTRDRERKANPVTSDDDGTNTGNDAGTATGNDAGIPDAVAQAEQKQNRSNTEQNQTTDTAPAAPSKTSDFDAFWSLYPKKVGGKIDAHKAFTKAVKAAGLDVVMAGLTRYANDRNLPDRQFIPNPCTWLNGGRWDDGPCDPRTGTLTTTPRTGSSIWDRKPPVRSAS